MAKRKPSLAILGTKEVNNLNPKYVHWDEDKEIGKANALKVLKRKEQGMDILVEPHDLSEIPDYESELIGLHLRDMGFKDQRNTSGERKRKEAAKLRTDINKLMNKQAYLPKGQMKSWRLELSYDISCGFETRPVPVFCDLDSVSANVMFTSRFKYIGTNSFKDKEEALKSEQLIHKCNCVGECKAGTCECINLQNHVNEDYHVEFLPDGRIMVDKPEKDCYTYLLVLCGDKCGCPKSCPNHYNRLRQKNSFDVFRRDFNLGFSLRTLSSIELGEIALEFIGRVMPYEELVHQTIGGEPDTRRVDYAYELYDSHEYHSMQGKIETYTTVMRRTIRMGQWRDSFNASTNLFIDPYSVGNVGRFMTCSCYPNLAPVRVVSNYLHPMRHHIFMFAVMPIAAGTELSFDYGKGYRERNQFVCLCRTPFCMSGPMKQFKNLIPINTVINQLIRLYRAWRKRSKERNEEASVIALDDRDFWETNPAPPRILKAPPEIWEKEKLELQNPVQDSDWNESKVRALEEAEQRREQKAVDANRRRERRQPTPQPEIFKRVRIDISPQRDSPGHNKNMREMYEEHEDDYY